MGYEFLSNNNKIMDMDVDRELKLKISRRDSGCFCFMNFVWVTKERKQPTKYAARWARMYSPFVQCNTG